MAPDPIISSIIDRYEHGAPVTAEEKAVLHKWLRHALKRRSILEVPPGTKSPFRSVRRKVRIWEFLLIVIIILVVIFMLYMLTFQTGGMYNEHDDVYLHN